MPFAYIHSGAFKTLATHPRQWEHELAYGLTVSRTGGTDWKHHDYRGRVVARRHYLDSQSIDLVVERDGRLERHQIVADGKQPKVMALDVPMRAAVRCIYGDATWSVVDGVLHMSDASGSRSLGSVPDVAIRCGPRGAVLDLYDRVYRCASECRQVFLSPAPALEGSAAILDDGRWVFVIPEEKVAAIWIEGNATPIYVRMTSIRDWREVWSGTSVIDGEIEVPPLSSKDFNLPADSAVP